MSFFYREKKFHSAINGQMIWRKFLLGGWILTTPQGEYYSSAYLERMWNFVVKKIKKIQPSKVLILGGGAGCAIQAVFKKWPNAQVVAVDYDRTILEIGKIIYPHFVKKTNLSLVVAEAVKFLTDNKTKYDLVLVDLMVGNKMSPLLKDKNFLRNLKNSVVVSGMVFANVATWLSGVDAEIINAWQEEFNQVYLFNFKSNKLIGTNLN